MFRAIAGRKSFSYKTKEPRGQVMKEFEGESIGKGGNVQGEGPCCLKIETERESSARKIAAGGVRRGKTYWSGEEKGRQPLAAFRLQAGKLTRVSCR